MKDIRAIFRRAQLSITLAFFVFCMLLGNLFLTFFLMFLMMKLGVSQLIQYQTPLLYFGISSLIISTLLSFIFGRVPLKPMLKIMEATDRIAAGDYSVRVDLNGPISIIDLGSKFNHMARELESVEMLRSDFISNFSHEFKTPIVSIRGFAKALKWEELTPEEREEYLDIIIVESERLSDLSTNVLALSRLEQQDILTDCETYNLTEQIRLVLALLDGKWSGKSISYDLEGEDLNVTGNREQLQQVWINLLDNAIKFSPEGGTVSVRVMVDSQIHVSIGNSGTPLSEEMLEHIFDKFYQGDRSHSTKGNGLGLSIAKAITVLHDGSITAANTEDGIVFTVTLPACDSGQT